MAAAFTSVPSTSATPDSSRTVTVTDSSPREEGGSSNASDDAPVVGTLRLRGGPRNRQRVAWDEDVIDNEGCGRKSSKVCCIYHKPRKFDESSSEESSDESDSNERPSGSNVGPRRSPNHRHGHSNHNHGHPHNGDHVHRSRPDTSVHQIEETDSDRNAYEVVPKGKGKKNARP